jgi:DNA modification methylase
MDYPVDFVNKVICGNCLEIINLIPNEILDGIVCDPPYGENQGYDGDETLDHAANLLCSFLKNVEPKVKRNGHVVIFWTMRNLDVCIDVLRSSGFLYRRTLCMYLPKGNARPYLGWLPRTQAIVIGQKYLPKQPSEFHRDMASYLSNAVAVTGLSRNEIARRLGCDSRLVMKWTRVGDPAWCLPTPRFYKPLKEILGLDDTFDVLLHRESFHAANKRDDFEYKHDTYVVDNKNEDMLHPAQKPLSVVEHLVSCISPKGGIIFDGFGGSGTTAVACKNKGRNFIVTEVSPDYCNVAKMRLNDQKVQRKD